MHISFRFNWVPRPLRHGAPDICLDCLGLIGVYCYPGSGHTVRWIRVSSGKRVRPVMRCFLVGHLGTIEIGSGPVQIPGGQKWLDLIWKRLIQYKVWKRIIKKDFIQHVSIDFICSVCFVIICSSSFLLVPSEGCTSRLWHFMGIFTSIRKHAYSNILKTFHHPKLNVFRYKNSDIFHISAQNIDCGYSLEPPQRGGSNEYPQSMFLSRNKKNYVYPCKPQFNCIKVGFKGVKII